MTFDYQGKLDVWSREVFRSQLVLTGHLLRGKDLKKEKISMVDLLPWSSMATAKCIRDGPKKGERKANVSWQSMQKIFLEVITFVLNSIYNINSF